MSAENPSNVTAVAIELGVVRVSWVNGQTSHDNNQVEYRDGDGSWVIASDTLAPDSTEFNVEHLDPSNLHDFRVTALDSGEGDSDAVSIERPIYTLPDGPGVYLVSQIQNPAVNDWTHLAVLTSASPFLRGQCVRKRNYESRCSTINIISNWRVGRHGFCITDLPRILHLPRLIPQEIPLDTYPIA